MRYLTTVVCVWHPETDDLLFEGASALLSVDQVREVVGAKFPTNPEPMTGYPVGADEGRKLLDLMGLSYDGDGEFQVSREPLKVAGSVLKH